MFAAFLSTVCGSLLSICVTALSAFSVTIIFRTSTTANFAQGSIAAFGCYVVAECLNRWGVPVYLGVLPGMIVGVVIGLFIDLMVFRKGRHVGELGKQINHGFHEKNKCNCSLFHPNNCLDSKLFLLSSEHIGIDIGN